MDDDISAPLAALAQQQTALLVRFEALQVVLQASLVAIGKNNPADYDRIEAMALMGAEHCKQSMPASAAAEFDYGIEHLLTAVRTAVKGKGRG